VDRVKDSLQTAIPADIEIRHASSRGNGDGTLHDCWNRIGVRGDRSCPELLRHIHCRNCPVFSAAARTLLDAPVPANFIVDATDYFARPASAAAGHAAAAEAQSVIVFRVRSEWFAIRTAVCVEIAGVRAIHSLPHRRDGAVLGLANVRGALLVCISLATILRVTPQPEAPPRHTTRSAVAPRLLVARGEAGPVAFPVDEVQGEERFHTRDLKEIPATVAQAQATYTRALMLLGDRSVGLLDEPLLFYTVERSLE
jgi:chemotaxis-related protein WspD